MQLLFDLINSFSNPAIVRIDLQGPLVFIKGLLQLTHGRECHGFEIVVISIEVAEILYHRE